MSFNNIIDAYQEKLIQKEHGYNLESDNDDELLDQLDDELDADFQSYREQRMQELSQQLKQSKRQIQEGHGQVDTLLSEESVLKTTTSTKRIVVHFFHDQFDKCKKMDDKLEVSIIPLVYYPIVLTNYIQILAQKHLSTKFIRINVDNAPFLVTRLGIKILPVVIVYLSGVESARIVGFDKLQYDENSDNFAIESLEKFLLDSGMSQCDFQQAKR
jgi:hypothetical protein